MVAFNTIPQNVVVPFFWVEINSGGSPFQAQPKLLLLGPKLSGGSATAGQVFGPIQSEAEAIENIRDAIQDYLAAIEERTAGEHTEEVRVAV